MASPSGYTQQELDELLGSGELLSSLGPAEDAVDAAWLAEHVGGVTVSSPDADALGVPSNPEPAECELPWEELRVVIMDHQVHQDSPVYTVTNLKWFHLEVALVDMENRLAVHNEMAIRATAVFESCGDVPSDGPHEPLLLGPQEIKFIHGMAKFKLKMGPKTLSDRHGRQKFRLRVEPVDPVLHAHKALTTFTEAFKSLTKLDRKKAPAAAAAAAAGASPFSPAGSAGTPVGGGTLGVALPNFHQLLEEEREARLQSELQMQARLEAAQKQLAEERASRERMNAELQRQGQLIEMLTAKLNITSLAPNMGAPAARFVLPAAPPGSGGSRPEQARVALAPTVQRSRSPKAGLDDEGVFRRPR